MKVVNKRSRRGHSFNLTCYNLQQIVLFLYTNAFCTSYYSNLFVGFLNIVFQILNTMTYKQTFQPPPNFLYERKMSVVLLNEDGTWQQLLKKKYLNNKTLPQGVKKLWDSHFWCGLMEIKDFFFARGRFIMQNRVQTRFWQDGQGKSR